MRKLPSFPSVVEVSKETLAHIETQGNTPGNFRSIARWYHA